MVTQLKKFYEVVNQTKTEVKWWSYAAWTLPFVALAAVVFEFYIGNDNWIQKTIWGITVVFFSVSVYWWWWALNKVSVILQALKKTEDDFGIVIAEIKETRKVIKEVHDSDRQWRESQKSKSRSTRKS